MQVKQLNERTIGGLHTNLIKVIEGMPELNSNISVLDIGCGTGAWLERLANKGYHALYGIDLDVSQTAIDKANILQANLDTDELCFDGQKFGLISAIEVIEHLENPGRLFDCVAKHLDDNGFFLLTTPNIHSVLCRFRFLVTGQLKQFDRKGDPTHIYPVLLTSLERILPRYQLEIFKQWSYPLDGGSMTSRKALKVVVSLLSILFPKVYPGDNLCLLIRKNTLLP